MFDSRSSCYFSPVSESSTRFSGKGSPRTVERGGRSWNTFWLQKHEVTCLSYNRSPKNGVENGQGDHTGGQEEIPEPLV